jgi:hypothetical protein
MLCPQVGQIVIFFSFLVLITTFETFRSQSVMFNFYRFYFRYFISWNYSRNCN